MMVTLNQSHCFLLCHHRCHRCFHQGYHHLCLHHGWLHFFLCQESKTFSAGETWSVIWTSDFWVTLSEILIETQTQIALVWSQIWNEISKEISFGVDFQSENGFHFSLEIVSCYNVTYEVIQTGILSGVLVILSVSDDNYEKTQKNQKKVLKLHRNSSHQQSHCVSPYVL